MNTKSIDKVDDSMQSYMDKNNIKYMVCDGLQKLQCIKNPSINGLYVRGDVSLLVKQLISIVGPRKMSQYGSRVLDNLFSQIRSYDLATVSGGAQGTDELVHILSLKYSIPTIVVLGGGIGWYKNTGKVHFLQKVVDQGGLILSEYNIFESPKKYTFPQRNRIIAGLGDIIFLPEAGLASGSLITVDRGVEYGKKIYAPMQDIFSEYGKGINQYIIAGKITPLDTISSFLSTYYTKKINHHLDGIIAHNYICDMGLNNTLITKSLSELGL